MKTKNIFNTAIIIFNKIPYDNSYTLTNNNKADPQSYVTTAAVYDSTTNKLLAVDIADAGTVAKGDTTSTITNTLDLTELSTDGSYTLKLFVWDGFSAAMPLTEVVYPLEQ